MGHFGKGIALALGRWLCVGTIAMSFACSTEGETSPPSGSTGGSSSGGGAGGDTNLAGQGAGGEADPLDTPPTAARYSGTVWGPHADGKPPLFPVPGALVVAHTTKPALFPNHAYCAECVKLPAETRYATSKADGSFVLELPTGATFWLTTEKGQFRRIREFTANAAIGDYTMEEALTTLPHRTDDALGDHVPKIALVYGDYDHIEDVLAKVGLADEDGAYGIDWGSEIFDVYDNAMPESGFPTEPRIGEPLDRLWGNLPSYHVVLFSCSYNAIFEFMEDPAKQLAIRNFVWNGGRLYVSDYAQPVMEMAWPEFVWHNDPLHGGCVENRWVKIRP